MAQQYIWLNGKFKKFEEVTVHVFTPTIQYGLGIFEGIRCYQTKKGVAVFRLREHAKRFMDSAKMYKMKLRVSQEELEEGIIETVRKNKIQNGYIRPFAFYDNVVMGFFYPDEQMNVSITAIEYGNYFQNKEKGLRCKVSSWRKASSDVLPPQAKVSGNYIASFLSRLDARDSGYDEAILLSANGLVAEGSGENIFLVEDNKVITPQKSGDFLLGITRDSAIKILESAGVEVEQRGVHREELYKCDELFFTGTAAEVTPVVNVDGRTIGNGKIGPITRMVSERFSKIVSGEDKQFAKWLTYV
ncbi:MAG: branched-chain amino acid transaminase [Candidatus Micrarchaeota archaeon]|nr:branched-chain amino acid transaminase [Candidatus Micrarchaeota archaeon]MDE1846576.1 branched-chain amino acid transaminase [Candidatus Micrarchaeota archaeon]